MIPNPFGFGTLSLKRACFQRDDERGAMTGERRAACFGSRT
jgi:hypothetical protein